MNVLAQLGEDGVERPDRAIDDESDRDGAPAALGIAQRIEQPVEPGRAVDSGRDRHRTRPIERRSRTTARPPIKHPALPSTNRPPIRNAPSQFAGLDAIDTRGHWLGAISLVDRGRPGGASVNSCRRSYRNGIGGRWGRLAALLLVVAVLGLPIDDLVAYALLLAAALLILTGTLSIDRAPLDRGGRTGGRGRRRSRAVARAAHRRGP